MNPRYQTPWRPLRRAQRGHPAMGVDAVRRARRAYTHRAGYPRPPRVHCLFSKLFFGFSAIFFSGREKLESVMTVGEAMGERWKSVTVTGECWKSDGRALGK